MDLAHEYAYIFPCWIWAFVSILVLVDLAHELKKSLEKVSRSSCFNPCFSGSCSRIRQLRKRKRIRKSFNPCFSGSCSRMISSAGSAMTAASFNPCFSGSCSRITSWTTGLTRILCFNPCFSGSCSRIST